jgi:hypothetical protein
MKVWRIYNYLKNISWTSTFWAEATNFPTKRLRSKRRNSVYIFHVVVYPSHPSFLLLSLSTVATTTHVNTHKLLQVCKQVACCKSVHKLSTSCVRTACYQLLWQVWNKLLTTCIISLMALSDLLQGCYNKFNKVIIITRMLQGWRHKVVIILLYHDCIKLVLEQPYNKSDNINKVVTSC